MIGFIILFVALVLLGWVVLYKFATGLRFIVSRYEEETKMQYISFLVMVLGILLLCIYINWF